MDVLQHRAVLGRVPATTRWARWSITRPACPQLLRPRSSWAWPSSPYRLYGTDDTLPQRQPLGFGGRPPAVTGRGFANVSRADSQGQPWSSPPGCWPRARLPTDLPSAAPSRARTQGAGLRDHRRLNRAPHRARPRQAQAGLTCTAACATYLLGLWQNQVDRDSRSYLKDASGNPVARPLRRPRRQHQQQSPTPSTQRTCRPRAKRWPITSRPSR